MWPTSSFLLDDLLHGCPIGTSLTGLFPLASPNFAFALQLPRASSTLSVPLLGIAPATVAFATVALASSAVATVSTASTVHAVHGVGVFSAEDLQVHFFELGNLAGHKLIEETTDTVGILTMLGNLTS